MIKHLFVVFVLSVNLTALKANDISFRFSDLLEIAEAIEPMDHRPEINDLLTLLSDYSHHDELVKETNALLERLETIDASYLGRDDALSVEAFKEKMIAQAQAKLRKAYLKGQGPIKKWGHLLNNFNLKELAFNFNVWAAKNKGTAFFDAVKDLVFILPFSHTLEVSFGPAVFALTPIFDISTSVSGPLMAIGGVISVPGLDPLCLLLVASYTTRSGRRFIRSARALTMSLAAPALQGLQRIGKHVDIRTSFSREDLWRSNGLYVEELGLMDGDQLMVRGPSNAVFMFKSENGHFVLSSYKGSVEGLQDGARLGGMPSTVMRQIGKLNETEQYYRLRNDMPHISKIEREDELLAIEFDPKAQIRVSKQAKKLPSASKICTWALRKILQVKARNFSP